MTSTSESLPVQSQLTTPGRSLLQEAPSRVGDRLFKGAVTLFAAIILLLAILVAWELWTGSSEARHAFGPGFITSTTWNPVQDVFGAGPFIFGTIVTSLFALLLAAPIGIGTAIFLTQLCPKWLRAPISFLVEMLAAIPSVIYGLWAIFTLVPIVRTQIQPLIGDILGGSSLASGAKYGVGLLSAGLVLTIMILPTATAISRDVLAAMPTAQRDGAYALGATRWEVMRGVILPAARTGIIGALFLALGRALGETMAVTMVIGNRAEIKLSFFALGDTMASVIANQFSEASSTLFTSVLIEIGLLLFAITLLLNLAARLLVWRLTLADRGGVR